MSMDLNEIRAARMYIFGLEAIDRIMADCRMTRQEVLHAIAQYSAEYRRVPRECDFCPWRSGDRPCVLPKGVCRL